MTEAPSNRDAKRPARDVGAIRRVVVKLGSSTIADLDITAFTDAMASLLERGLELAIVTSGAVSCGMQRLGVTSRPDELARVQALAAVGQVDLMARYRAAFERHGVACAQVLMTHQALATRRDFMNLRHTLRELLEMGVVPVVNENDTVATEELRFGDNDRLAAAFATLIEADLVVLLSDIDALYDADPRVHPEARPIAEVTSIDGAIRAAAGSVGSEVGTGGMASKVDAAEIAVGAGIPLVIALGDDPSVTTRILAGEPIGTWFCPPSKRVDRRRHWIGFLSQLHGSVTVDAGAVVALVERGSSLLPIGVTAVSGSFRRGDGIAIREPDGSIIGRGLVGYDADTLGRIIGQRSDVVAKLLNRRAVDPVVHRNDMVLDP